MAGDETPAIPSHGRRGYEAVMTDSLMAPPGSKSQGSRAMWARTVFIIGLLLISWAARVLLDLLRETDGPGYLMAAGALGGAIIPWFFGLIGYVLSGRRTALVMSGVVMVALVLADRL